MRKIEAGCLFQTALSCAQMNKSGTSGLREGDRESRENIGATSIFRFPDETVLTE